MPPRRRTSMLRGSSCSAWIAVGLLSLTLGSPLSRAEDQAPRASERRDQRLAEKLAENVDVYENGVPLRTFVTDLAMRQGVEVRFDEREIAAQSIPLDRPVSVNRKGATLESVFARVLRKYGLEARNDAGAVVIG